MNKHPHAKSEAFTRALKELALREREADRPHVLDAAVQPLAAVLHEVHP